MLPFASTADSEVGAKGLLALWGGGNDACDLPLHEAVLLLRNLYITDISGGSKGYEKHLAFDMSKCLAFACESRDRHLFKERKIFLFTCQLSCKP